LYVARRTNGGTLGTASILHRRFACRVPAGRPESGRNCRRLSGPANGDGRKCVDHRSLPLRNVQRRPFRRAPMGAFRNGPRAGVRYCLTVTTVPTPPGMKRSP
jgi:hypothetical protein